MNPEHGSPPDSAADQLVAGVRAAAGDAALLRKAEIIAAQPSLIDGLKALLAAESTADFKAALRGYPELLSEDGEFVAQTIAAGSPPEARPLLERVTAVIAHARSSGLQVGLAELREDQVTLPDEVPVAVRPLVAQAHVLFSDYNDHADVEALDAAVERWELALGAPEWQQIPDEIRIVLESDCAAMRLGRYGASGDERDLTAVIEALTEIVKRSGVAPASARQNLAHALRDRYDRSGDPGGSRARAGVDRLGRDGPSRLSGA